MNILLYIPTPSELSQGAIDMHVLTQLWLPLTGAVFFGAVVGWMTHHVFRNTKKADVTWLASMVGVIGGGAVTAIFDKGGAAFGAYCIGLAVFFFVRAFLLPILLWGKSAFKEVEKEFKEAEKELKKEEADIKNAAPIVHTESRV